MPPRALREATAVGDALASSGAARRSRPPHTSGFVVFGPWIDLDPGRYQARVALRLDGLAEPGTAARFSVFSAATRTLVAGMPIPGDRLRRDGYEVFTLPFELEAAVDDVAFRVRTPSNLRLRVDYVELVPVLP